MIQMIHYFGANFMNTVILLVTLISSANLYSQESDNSKKSEILNILNKTNKNISLEFLGDGPNDSKKEKIKDRVFALAKEKYTPKQFEDFEKWYASTAFYNMNRTLNWNMRQTNYRLKRFRGFDRWGERPLEGYLKAKKIADNLDVKDITTDKIGELHKKLLSSDSIDGLYKAIVRMVDGVNNPGNSQGLQTDLLGKVRSYQIGYMGSFEDETKDAKFRTTIPQSKDSLLKYTIKNPLVDFTKHPGYISYFHPEIHFKLDTCLKLELDHSICYRMNRDLFEIRNGSFCINYTDQIAMQSRSAQMAKDYHLWLSAHIDKALKNLNYSLRNAKTNKDIIDSASTFFWKLIGFHAFGDGNGRTSRVILEKILEAYNLPTPIFSSNFGTDITLSEKDFSTVVTDAVALSKKFNDDLIKLLENDIPYSYVNSHYLAPGHFSEETFKKMNISPKEFSAWLMINKSNKASVTKRTTPEEAVREFTYWRSQPESNKIITKMFMQTGLPAKYWD